MKKKLLKHAIFFIIIIILTFIFIISKAKEENIYNIISIIDIRYVAFGVLLMTIFISAEGLNIKIVLSNIGYKVSLFDAIKYSAVGFFYSSITPGASGGQPMQVYHMKKDGIDISHSVISLLIILCSFQIVNLLYLIISYIYNKNYLINNLDKLGILFIIGISLNAISLIAILIVVFVSNIGNKILKITEYIMIKFNIKNKEERINKIEKELDEYKKSSVYIKKNKLIFLKLFLITIMQFTASYSISYIAYRSFGLNDLSYFKLLTLQAVLYSSISSIPMPGAMGISEIGFEVLYKPIYGNKLISSAVIFTRLSNFYIMVIITCIISIYAHFENPKIASKK